MLKVLILVGVMIVAGCSGDGTVEFVNNSSSYVEGTLDGAKWGVGPNGRSRRSIKVGGTFSKSSDVTLTSVWHEDWRQNSRVIKRDSDSFELSVDEVMVYEFFYNTSNSVPAVRQSRELHLSRSPLAP